MNDRSYINFGKEELLAAPKIPLVLMSTSEEIFQAMADEMIEIINKNNTKGVPTAFILPVGPTGQYKYFVERINKEEISLKECWFINMDEYLTDDDQWIPEDHFMSFRGFMNREVYGKINSDLCMSEKQRIFPDPSDPENVSRVLDKVGKLDAVFGGIGVNGHVAFNEADETISIEAFSALPTRVTDIALETRVVNALDTMKGAFYAMPSRCVTVGFQDILRAEIIRLGVFRPWHRSVIRTAAYGEQGAWFPVTILRNHRDTIIRLPEAVAE